MLDHVIFANDKFFSFRENMEGKIEKDSRIKKGEGCE